MREFQHTGLSIRDQIAMCLQHLLTPEGVPTMPVRLL